MHGGGSPEKANRLSTVVKNTSCNHGWLRLVMQWIFAGITVTSFILIFRMTILVRDKPQYHTPRCLLSGCKIMCREAPFFGDFEYDIVQAVTDASFNYCKHVVLHLDNPMFINNTLPTNFLSQLRSSVHELTINNGNLMSIPADAFMNQYLASIRMITFYKLAIRSWTTESFLGLTSLLRFVMTDCIIVNPPRDPLRSVDDTLLTLSITNSENWDPARITGATTFSSLIVVDFSSNSFYNILGRSSFTGLQNCRSLYLNSCKITAIGSGAFDSLKNIEILYLHNNYLIEISDNLFTNLLAIVNPKPRMNLQNNLWNCSCSDKNLRELIRQDVLMTDPICENPDNFRHKTFTQFEEYCTANEPDVPKMVKPNVLHTPTQVLLELERPYGSSGFVYVSNGTCYNGDSDSNISYNSAIKMVSPIYGNRCYTQDRRRSNDIASIVHFRELGLDAMNIDSSWIKFTYLTKSANYSMLQIGTVDLDNYGIVWYQSTCPNEVYCVSHVPQLLRIYNADPLASYVFCPIRLMSGNIDVNKCVYHEVNGKKPNYTQQLKILYYVTTGLVCLVCGALCVYGVILKYPNLLKGSKRILFVKHKKVEALVLPPKVPLRKETIKKPLLEVKEDEIFVIPTTHYLPRNCNRRSMRSMKSNAPSYISALLPTEDQLAEWRIRHHFNNDLTITSHSEISFLSWNKSDDSAYSIDYDNEIIYESLK
ncbi:unnamed protein product [Chrysodeixis includens]|uniref:Uncharacterized protein n=1 Tax=Chrysodeixis includens TaxID=689277 RepID=A0A9P0FVP9_CHRIL|nr:unnamed protein product [Chrysodeixis includens]